MMNDDLENKNYVEKLIEKYDIQQMIVSVYHLQANDMIKRGHKSLTNALSKMTNENLTE